MAWPHIWNTRDGLDPSHSWRGLSGQVFVPGKDSTVTSAEFQCHWMPVGLSITLHLALSEEISWHYQLTFQHTVKLIVIYIFSTYSLQLSWVRRSLRAVHVSVFICAQLMDVYIVYNGFQQKNISAFCCMNIKRWENIMIQGSTFGMNEMLSTTKFGLHKLQCIFIDPAENTSNTLTIKQTVDFHLRNMVTLQLKS